MNTQRREQLDGLFKIIFKGTGILTIVLLAGIFFMLFANSLLFFLEVSPIDFFTGSQWDPETNYSILPLLLSTSLVALGSMLIAVPLGVLTAAFLSEFAPKKMQLILKPMIEMLAAIPSVAIGFLGIVLVGPGLSQCIWYTEWTQCTQWFYTSGYYGITYYRHCQ
jgi:phosphate transport system permease protein